MTSNEQMGQASNDDKKKDAKGDTSGNRYSSFSRLLGSSQDMTKDASEGSRMKRRSSLFDNVSRSRPGDRAEEQSAFSFSSLTTKEPSSLSECQAHRRTSIGHKRPRMSNSSSTNSSTSRSLFPPPTQTNPTNITVAETQNQTNLLSSNNNINTTINTKNTSDTNDTSKSVTPKASGRGEQALSNKGSLFGSVMQQVQQHEKASTPSKWKHHTPNKRRSPFRTPESKRAGMPFGSPGGFQLLDFVNSVASPFSRHSNHSHSNMSTKSAPPNEWQNTTVAQGVMDWSLPKSLRFDCHPGTVVNPLLQTSKQAGGEPLGLMKFLKPITSSTASMLQNDSEADLGLAHWGSGLMYWQHPAVHPTPFLDAAASASQPPKPTKGQENHSTEGKDDAFSKLKKQQQRKSMDFSGARPLSELGNISYRTDQRKSSYKQQSNFTKRRRLEWQQAYTSLFWKWVSQLQQQRHSGQTQQLQKTYFYSLGQDHAVLFLADETDGEVIPKIIFSASSAAFRNKLRQTGVQDLRLLEAWNGRLKDTVFLEDMIQQKPPPKPDTNSDSNSDKTKTKNTVMNTTTQSNSSATSATQTPSKLDIAKKLLSPGNDSSSPKVEAELAALRRAQVFGETVGADVKVSIKPKVAAAQKLALTSVPPLYVAGWDDCVAFFEVYLNLGSSCSIPYPTAATVTATEGEKKAAKHKTKTTPPQDKRWQLPGDVPLLICRGVGPFLHSTMKSLTVQGEMQYPDSKARSDTTDDNQDYASLEVFGGPILPCAVHDLVCGMAHTMNADKKYSINGFSKDSLLQGDDDSESEGVRDEDDAMVGSHNFILRVIPANREEGVGESESIKYGLIGSCGSQFFNHGEAEDDTDKSESENPVACTIQNGYSLNMEVWDILHLKAMAYKLEPVAFPASALSLL